MPKAHFKKVGTGFIIKGFNHGIYREGGMELRGRAAWVGSMSCNTQDSPCEQSSKLEGVEGSVCWRIMAWRWWAHCSAACTVLDAFPPVVWIKWWHISREYQWLASRSRSRRCAAVRSSSVMERWLKGRIRWLGHIYWIPPGPAGLAPNQSGRQWHTLNHSKSSQYRTALGRTFCLF